MSNELNLREQEIVEVFGMFDDWMGRYEYLIEQGRKVPLIDDRYKTEEYLIHGCQSQVWVRSDVVDGRIVYTADSDAQITRGLVALLIQVLSGLPAEEVVQARLSFIDAIGLQEHLSPTRKNGLAGMIRQMKLAAARAVETEAKGVV